MTEKGSLTADDMKKRVREVGAPAALLAIKVLDMAWLGPGPCQELEHTIQAAH